MSMKVLDARRAHAVTALCEQIIPGSGRVGPAVYIDALLAKMPAEEQAGVLAAIDSLMVGDSVDSIAAKARTPEFALMRALAIEAYYSDFVAPGMPGPSAWAEIGFEPPRAIDLERNWGWLRVQ